MRITLSIALLSCHLAFSPGCRLGFDVDAYCYGEQDCKSGDTSDIPSPDGDEEVSTDTIPDAPLTDTPGPCQPTEDCDLDGIIEEADNCPGIWNPSQLNWDTDAWGDECDPCPFVDQGLTGGICPGTSLDPACDRSGTWRGTVTSWNNAVPEISLQKLILSPDGTALVSDGHFSSYSCPAPRVMRIEGLGSWTTAGEDAHAVLVLDARHELAVGHLVEPTSGRILSGTQILLIRVSPVPDGMDPQIDVLPEGGRAPNDTSEATWILRGVGKPFDDSADLTLTGTFVRKPPKPGNVVNEWVDGTLLLYNSTSPLGEPFLLQTLDVAGNPGTFHERPGSQCVLFAVVTDMSGKTVGSLTCVGFINLSRDFATMLGTLEVNDVELNVGIVLSRTDETEGLPANPLAVIGHGKTHSMRGQVLSGTEATGTTGWVVQPHSTASAPTLGLLSNGQTIPTEFGQAITLEPPAPAIVLGDDKTLQAHHVCVSMAPGGPVGIAAVCETDGTPTCDKTYNCVSSVAVVLPWDAPTASQAKDLDLDGLGSMALDGCSEPDDTNQSGEWDSDPCLLMEP